LFCFCFWEGGADVGFERALLCGLQAETLCRNLLAVQLHELGENHLDTFETSNTLANVLIKQGKFAEAQAVQTALLTRQKMVLGAEDLGTMCNLAISLNSQGKHDRAVVVYRRVLMVQKRLLGEEHPDTLGTACNLGCVCWPLPLHHAQCL
jgi:hypothetical protein